MPLLFTITGIGMIVIGVKGKQGNVLSAITGKISTGAGPTTLAAAPKVVTK
jgi:hypothetical protein